MKIYNYDIVYCLGDTPLEYPLPEGKWDAFPGETIPSWLTVSYGSLPFNDPYFTFDITTEGLYTFSLDGGETQSAQITILAIDCASIDRECVNSGCISNIAWLNLEGGWSSYVFSSAKDKKVYEKNIGDSINFKYYDRGTGDKILQTTQINDVYDVEVVSSGYIPLSHLPFVEALKYSISQYLYNEDRNSWSIPIVINKESFTLKRCNNGLVEYNFTFRYAKEIIVQTQ